MQEIYRLDAYLPAIAGSVVSIGNFDGVHRGHQSIIAAARRIAGEAVPMGGAGAPQVVVITFEPHPIAILRPDRAPPRLTTPRGKLALLAHYGVDAAIVLRSEAALLDQTAEEFLEHVVRRCAPRAFVEGATFNFGRGRHGSVQTLRDAAGRYGYAVQVVDDVVCSELTGAPTASSSAVRAALAEGRLHDANVMLGRAYRIVGVVGHGESRGAAIGFPTANLIAIGETLPREGVYAAAAQLASGGLYLAAVNIGPQPTFGQAASRVEAHLLDFAGDLRGQRIGLHLLALLRGQVRFSGVNELVSQLRRDVEKTREFRPRLNDGTILPVTLSE